MLEASDIEEALTAASAIGDDHVQNEGRGQVVPETVTCGTSRQRGEWFKRGIERGATSRAVILSPPASAGAS